MLCAVGGLREKAPQPVQAKAHLRWRCNHEAYVATVRVILRQGDDCNAAAGADEPRTQSINNQAASEHLLINEAVEVEQGVHAGIPFSALGLAGSVCVTELVTVIMVSSITRGWLVRPDHTHDQSSSEADAATERLDSRLTDGAHCHASVDKPTHLEVVELAVGVRHQSRLRQAA